MATTIFPTVNDFAGAIFRESQVDFPTQRLILADRLFKLSPVRMENFHLEDWYKLYWNIVSLARHVTTLSEKDNIACRNVLAAAVHETNPIRRQFLAMILLMFGKTADAMKFTDQSVMTSQLREDFVLYEKWSALLNNDLDLRAKATIRRNLDIAEFLRNRYADLVKKYADVVVNDQTCPKVAPKDYRIYFCWLQGETNMPPLVKCCYNSLKMNAGRYKICFIDDNNFSDYVDIPEYILKKYRGGGGL